MKPLQRMTIEFDEVEDRIRLSGATGAADVVVLWLTRRLLDRLVPHLCAWIERRNDGAAGGAAHAGVADLAHGFAQQAAIRSIAPSPPVEAVPATAEALVHSVDVTCGEHACRLSFRGGSDLIAQVELPAQVLRQFLGIVHAQYSKAGWPMAIWPGWMEASDQTATAARGPLLLH